jgi:anaerobic magnesium-protoporphyrin IX monomethyl ester cyclase
MNILVLFPRLVDYIGQYYDMQLGLVYISSTIKHHGYNVTVVNLNHEKRSVQAVLQDVIINEHIDILCIGGQSTDYNRIKRVISISKQISPDIITIVGGGLVSSLPILIYNKLEMTFGVFGEGERTIIELLKAIESNGNYQQIDGLIYKNSEGEVVQTKPRKVSKDLDYIPFPDYEGFGLNTYLDLQRPNDSLFLYPEDNPRMIPMSFSRSCPYSCTFCYQPTGQIYRKRSISNFFTELDLITNRYDVNLLAVYDDLFSVKRDRTIEFCERIKPYGIKWIAQMRVDMVDNELLEILYDSGCYNISYGIESMDETVLVNMKKKTKSYRVAEALEETYQNKIGIQGNFIFGDSAETMETANNTLDWWKKHKKYTLNLFPILTYPGSGLYIQAVQKGVITDEVKFLEDGCPLINVSKISDDDFSQLVDTLEHHNTYHGYNGKLISFKQEGEDSIKGLLYTAEVECPHCNKTSTYKNIHSKNGVKLSSACRICNQRYNLYIPELLTHQLNKRMKEIFTQTNNKKIAIWGAGEHTTFLLENTVLKNSNISCIFDKNEAKNNIKINNINVIAPAPNSADDIKKYCDAIIISTKVHENTAYDELLYLQDKGVMVYKLYCQDKIDYVFD